MKVVKVYGALRKKLGQCRFEFVADTPAEAMRALIANFPGLDKWLIDSAKDGVGYRVSVGKEKATEDDISVLHLPWSERQVFSITPVLTGAGGGGGRTAILIGVGLVAASFLFPGAGLFGTSGWFGAGTAVTSATAGATGTAIALTKIGTAVSLLGAGLILKGVADLISGTPQIGGSDSVDEVRKLESFSFSNIANTTKQGLPVPIIYGRVFTGSAVISAGIDTEYRYD